MGPPYWELKCDEVAERTLLYNVAVIYFGDTKSPFFTAFHKVSSDDLKSEYFHVKDREGKCAEKYGTEKNSILIFRTFDISPLQYGGASNA